jgi:hypothetical protein
MKKLLALVGALAAVLVLPIPAAAGGWAVTYLDPLPEHMQAGQGYTAGYWVLQHGNHPSVIPLTETGLKFTSASGEVKYYRGLPLHEVSHFAVAILVPHDGTWTVEAVQQPFGPYKVGELTVPGGLELSPFPAPLAHAPHDDHAWGEIRPPLATAGSHSGHTSTVAMSGATAKLPAPAPTNLPAALLVLAVLGGALAGVALLTAGRRLTRTLRSP